MKEKDKLRFVLSEKIPFYSMLCDYKWVPDFLKLEAAKDELTQLIEQEHEPVTLKREEFLKQLREQWQDYETSRQKEMKKFLNQFRFEGSNPFDNYIVFKLEVRPFLPFEQFESALHEKDELGTSLEDKQKKELSIKTRRKSLEDLIKKLCPKDYFVVSGGQVTVDVREKYVTRWRELQQKVDLPIAPNGILLNESPENEKKAWLELIGYDYVNPHAKLTPDSN